MFETAPRFHLGVVSIDIILVLVIYVGFPFRGGGIEVVRVRICVGTAEFDGEGEVI